jgi:hypothetical protein
MKKSNILCIILVIIAVFFLGKTVYCTISEKESDCIEYKQIISNLDDQLEEKQKIIDSLQINSWLFEDYYCSSENLFDTIFHYAVTEGIFVFEYEPYVQSSNSIWAYEELYNYLEEKRNSWK